MGILHNHRTRGSHSGHNHNNEMCFKIVQKRTIELDRPIGLAENNINYKDFRLQQIPSSPEGESTL